MYVDKKTMFYGGLLKLKRVKQSVQCTYYTRIAAHSKYSHDRESDIFYNRN